MKILMLVRQFYPWIGGTERQAQKLASQLIEQGISVKVVTGWWFLRTKQKDKIGKIPVARLFTFWGMFGIRGIRKIGGYLFIMSTVFHMLLHRKEYDLIHVHLLSYHAFPAVFMAKILKKKSIIKIANSSSYSDLERMKANDLIPGQKQMLPVALKADRFIALNWKIVEELSEAGVERDRVVLINNGVEIEEDHKKDYAILSHITLLFLGRLHPQKNLDLLIRVFKMLTLKAKAFHWELWLVGDGPLRFQLEEKSTSLGLKNHIKFCGNTDDTMEKMRKADLFMLLSQAEGMSNSLLEAMAFGLPCIVSNINGNRQIVQHGKTGILVDLKYETEIADTVIRLSKEEETRRLIGQNAREMIEREFGIDKIARKYIDVYADLLEE